MNVVMNVAVSFCFYIQTPLLIFRLFVSLISFIDSLILSWDFGSNHAIYDYDMIQYETRKHFLFFFFFVPFMLLPLFYIIDRRQEPAPSMNGTES